jgi:tellurite resistance protein
MVQAVVADFDEPGGQDVLEEAADELHHGQRHAVNLFRLGVAVAERDGVAVVLADGGVGEGDA